MIKKLFTITAIALGINAYSQTWQPLGMGVNGGVSDICADKATNTIYVLGNFTSASGVSCQGLAKWDGATWAAIPIDTLSNGYGPMAGNSYTDIEFYNGKLYATGSAGYNNKSAPFSTNLLWEWDGGHWIKTNNDELKIDTVCNCPQTFGGSALKVINNKLYGLRTGGRASMDGGLTYRDGIFSWDGTTAQWETTNLLPYVYSYNWGSYDIYNNNLYCISNSQNGASFTYYDTLFMYSANWSIPSNSNFPYDFNASVIQHFNNNLYIGSSGKLLNYNYNTGINPSTTTFINTNSAVYANGIVEMALGSNMLFLGGGFNNINGFAWASPNVAKFDGTNYYPLGTGFDNYVTKIIDCNGKLYAGGGFQYAGSTAVNYISVYDMTNGIDQFNFNNSVTIYPNPSSSICTIKSNMIDKINANLYDVNGRHILSKVVNGSADIDISSLENGVYNLILKTNSSTINKKLVIVR